jgi:hypothetical protein
MQAIPLESGNQELLRRKRHQAYKTIDKERSSNSSTQMENFRRIGCGVEGEKKKKRREEISKWEGRGWEEGSRRRMREMHHHKLQVLSLLSASKLDAQPTMDSPW